MSEMQFVGWRTRKNTIKYMIEIYLVSYTEFLVTIISHAISFINSNISGETEYAVVSC